MQNTLKRRMFPFRAVADAILHRKRGRFSCSGDFPSDCHLTRNIYSTYKTTDQSEDLLDRSDYTVF